MTSSPASTGITGTGIGIGIGVTFVLELIFVSVLGAGWLWVLYAVSRAVTLHIHGLLLKGITIS